MHMDFKSMSNKAILAEIGDRISRRRLNQNVSQIELARLAGISRIVVQRLESGLGCKLESLIQILRGLNLIDQLDTFLPEQGISPIQLAKLKGNERRRATRRQQK
jgi:transcriptional regulator with XRE-family HTH domain